MDVRYPIGRFAMPEHVEMSDIEKWIENLEQAPQLLRNAVEGLNKEQLDTPYRPEGWTVRQVVHHVADSHTNSYINFRLGLLEDNPTVRATNVDALAGLFDAKTADIEMSLNMLTALHGRWIALLRSMDEADFARIITTPGRGERSLAMLLGTYAWHGQHHAAHITSLREKMGW